MIAALLYVFVGGWEVQEIRRVFSRFELELIHDLVPVLMHVHPHNKDQGSGHFLGRTMDNEVRRRGKDMYDRMASKKQWRDPQTFMIESGAPEMVMNVRSVCPWTMLSSSQGFFRHTTSTLDA